MLCFTLVMASPALAARATETDASGSTPGRRLPEGAKVTMDFRDVDIRVVAKFISELTGKNFIFDNKVRDKVTVFSPTEVTPEEAYNLFETVLKIQGYTTVPGKNVIKIMPSQEARTTDVETRDKPPASGGGEDRVVTQLIRLRHADVNEMKALLQPLMNKTGILMAYDSGNTLIITDYASNIERMVKILQAVDVADEVTRLSVIELKNASAKEVAGELQEILQGPSTRTQARKGAPTPSGGRLEYVVVPDERTNNLIVMARPSETRIIRDIVSKLDIATPRGSDRVHVYFLKHAVAEDLAATLNELAGKEAAAAPGKSGTGGATRLMLQEPVFITAEKSTNSLIIRAERQDYLVLKDIIEQLDIQRAQVLVEGVVMEMSVRKANALGAEWRILNPSDDGVSVFGGTGTNSESLINQMSANPFNGAEGLILGAAEGTLTWGGSTILNIGALIRALEQDAGVDIISTPHLLTMDNEEAKIIVGEERPFLKSSTTNVTETTNVTNTYEFKDLGLTLKITPHITKGEFIKLKIYQELKSYVDETETGAITSTKRETETTVQVKNQETVVIGGMIQDEQRNRRTSVPCLGNTPVLGWAFKSREQEDDKLNLLILIKPTIIRTAEMLHEMTEKKRGEVEAISEQVYPGPDEGFPRSGPRIMDDPYNKRNKKFKKIPRIEEDPLLDEKAEEDENIDEFTGM